MDSRYKQLSPFITCSVLLDAQYLCEIYIPLSIVFVTFHVCLKVPLKNIKQVIPEEDVFDVIHKYRNIMNNHSSSKTIYHQVRLYLFTLFFASVFYKCQI